MSKKVQETPDGLESVNSALSKTEQYIEDNQKSLSIVVTAIAVVIAIYLGYKKFYLNPLEKEASSQMFGAEQYFEKDSFNLALYGDGNYMGFVDIADDYGITKSANLANYYAGISYLREGEFEEAIDYLKKFDSDDIIVSSIALGAIGDAYSEMENYEEAVKYYQSAADNNPDKFSAPIYLMKQGKLLEILENNEKALKVYKEIQEKYPDTQEGRNVVKYIARVESKL